MDENAKKEIEKEQKVEAKKAEPIKEVKLKKSKVRGFFGSFVNVRGWVSYDLIASSARGLGKSAKALFVPKKPEHHETFYEAKERLNLSEEDITKRRDQFLRSSLIYAGMALILVGYGVYLFFSAGLLTSYAATSLGVLVGAYAIRENFWYMQMKKRKLGCTLSEWFNFVKSALLGERK